MVQPCVAESRDDNGQARTDSFGYQASVALVLLLALTLRLLYARQISMFVDEFTTIWAAQRVLDTGLPVFPSGNFYSHGMVFTYIEAAFRLVGGTGTLVARLPSVLIGTATVAALYGVGSRLFNRPVALLAACWLAADPDAIVWGGRARMYALLQLLILLAVYVFYRGVSPNGRLRDRLTAMILLTAALFTQPEAALLLPVLGLVLLWQRGLLPSLHPRAWLPFGIPVAGLAALFLLNKLGQPGHLEAIQSSRPYFRLPGHLLRGVEVFAPAYLAAWRLPATLLFAVGIFWLAARLVRRDALSSAWQSLVASYLVVLPILFVLVFLVGPTWQRKRYAFMLWPLFYLAAAFIAWHSLGRRFRFVWQWIVVVAVLFALTLHTGLSYAFAPVEEYDLAFAYVRDHWQPGDAIASPVPAASMLYLGQSDYFAIQRAYEEYVMTHNGQQVDRWTDAPPLASPTDLQAALRAHRRLWFVVDGWRFETRYDIKFAQTVLEQMAMAHADGGVVAYLGEGYEAPLPPAITRRLQADFGGELRLDAYDRSPADPQPGDLLQFALHWRALAPSERRYTLYLHLTDRDGRTVAQVDEGILGGRYRPLFWPSETLVRDHHALPIPSDLPAGRYRLVAGLYDETPEQPVGHEIPLDYVWIGPLAQSPAPQTPLSADFGDRLRLLGYDLVPAAEGQWRLTLYWQATKPVTEDFTVFVHLVGPGETIWGQHDAPPGGGFFPTSFWLPGDHVADEHDIALRDDAPPGTYELVIGLYRPDTGERLSVEPASSGSVADRLMLTTVSAAGATP